MVLRVKASEFSEGSRSKLHKILEKGVARVAQRKVDERGDKPRTLYASDYGKCCRQVWYQFFPKEYPTDELDARTLRIFGNGESVHLRLGAYLKESPEIDFREEVDVPRDELDVHGRCDGICTVDDRAVVVEFKSINKKRVLEPKEEHEGQLMWYLSMWRMVRKQLKEDFGFQEGDVLSEKDIVGESASGLTLGDLNDVQKWLLFTQGEIQGEVVYESKQTQGFDTFPVEYDPEKEAKVRQWFVAMKWFIDNKHLPPVKYDQNRYPCRWGFGESAGQCVYHEYCWGKGAEGDE